MTTIDLTESEVIVNIEGFDEFLSAKSQLRVPLAHVDDVASGEADARRWFHGLRFGTNIPGVVTAGTFLTTEGRVFWDVHSPAGAIEIRLHEEHFVKLIVEVRDPSATLARIRAAIGRDAPATE